MNAIDVSRSPLEKFRGEASRRADLLGITDFADREEYVQGAMLALAYEATMRDTKPMRDALARNVASCLYSGGIFVNRDGSITPIDPPAEVKRAEALLREHVRTVAHGYGLTSWFDDAPPPTSPPAPGSDR